MINCLTSVLHTVVYAFVLCERYNINDWAIRGSTQCKELVLVYQVSIILNTPWIRLKSKYACIQMHDQYETRCHNTMTLYLVLGSNLVLNCTFWDVCKYIEYKSIKITLWKKNIALFRWLILLFLSCMPSSNIL